MSTSDSFANCESAVVILRATLKYGNDSKLHWLGLFFKFLGSALLFKKKDIQETKHGNIQAGL